MKKKLLSATLIAIAGLGTVPALAQSTGTVTVNGAVADRCLFTTDAAVINIPELSNTGTGSTAGKLNAGTVNGQTRTLVGWCNGTAAQMSVEAFPLIRSFVGAVPTGFDNRVDYTALATANAVPGTDTSVTGGAGAAVNVGIFTGNIPVVLSAASSPTGGLLLAGTYTGSVVVTLSPNTALPPG